MGKRVSLVSLVFLVYLVHMYIKQAYLSISISVGSGSGSAYQEQLDSNFPSYYLMPWYSDILPTGALMFRYAPPSNYRLFSLSD